MVWRLCYRLSLFLDRERKAHEKRTSPYPLLNKERKIKNKWGIGISLLNKEGLREVLKVVLYCFY